MKPAFHNATFYKVPTFLTIEKAEKKTGGKEMNNPTVAVSVK